MNAKVTTTPIPLADTAVFDCFTVAPGITARQKLEQAFCFLDSAVRVGSDITEMLPMEHQPTSYAGVYAAEMAKALVGAAVDDLSQARKAGGPDTAPAAPAGLSGDHYDMLTQARELMGDHRSYTAAILALLGGKKALGADDIETVSNLARLAHDQADEWWHIFDTDATILQASTQPRN